MNSTRLLILLAASATLALTGCGKKNNPPTPNPTPTPKTPSNVSSKPSTPAAKPAQTPSVPAGQLADSAIVDQAGGVDKLLASELFVQGRAMFITSCTACHGPEGQAKPHLGKDIADSAFVAQRTDDQMVTYIKTGRPVNDPLNTTGVPMPPKGGNPAITDAQIHQIIAYIRVLQAAARGEVQLPPTPAG